MRRETRTLLSGMILVLVATAPADAAWIFNRNLPKAFVKVCAVTSDGEILVREEGSDKVYVIEKGNRNQKRIGKLRAGHSYTFTLNVNSEILSWNHESSGDPCEVLDRSRARVTAVDIADNPELESIAALFGARGVERLWPLLRNLICLGSNDSGASQDLLEGLTTLNVEPVSAGGVDANNSVSSINVVCTEVATLRGVVGVLHESVCGGGTCHHPMDALILSVSELLDACQLSR